MQHKTPLKILKITGIVFAGLFSTVILLIGGLVLWLHTEHADNFIKKNVTEILQAQGLTLETDEFKGPVPFDLHLSKVTLADSEGVWLRANSIDLAISFWPLLTRTLDIDLVNIDSPELIRLPVLPAAETPAPEVQPAAKNASKPFSLPLTIKLDNLHLAKGKLHQRILIGNECDPNLQPLAIAASGKAVLTPTGVSADIDAAILHGSGNGFRLTVSSAPPPKFILSGEPDETLRISNQDNLYIRLIAMEKKGGLLSTLTGDAGIPAYALKFEGHGVPKDWKAKFFFAAGEHSGVNAYGIDLENDELASGTSVKNITSNAPAETAEQATADVRDAAIRIGDNAEHFIHTTQNLAAVRGTFELAAANPAIRFEHILETVLKTNLKLEITPGNQLPDKIRPVLEPKVNFGLAAQIENNLYKITDTTLSNMDWNANLVVAELDMRKDDLLFSSNLKAELHEGLFDKLFAGSPTHKKIQLRQATLQTTTTAEKKGRHLNLASDGTVKATVNDDHIPLNWHSLARVEGTHLTLEKATVDSLGMNLDAKGEANTTKGTAEFDATLKCLAGGLWQELAQSLAGETKIPDGNIRLTASLETDELNTFTASAEHTASQELNGTQANVALSGNTIEWHESRMQSLLGSSMDAKIQLNGSKNRGYKLKAPAITAGKLRASADATLSAQGIKYLEKPSKAARAKTTQQDLQAELKIFLEDLADFSPHANGPTSALLKSSGNFDNLNIAADITMPDLKLEAHEVRDFRASLQGSIAMLADSLKTGGELSTSFNHNQAGNVKLNSGWDVALPNSGTTEVKINQLTLAAKGIAVAANMAARLPQNSTANPALIGDADINITDWSALAALSGLRIDADPAKLKLNLKENKTGAQAEQNAVLECNFGKLIIADRYAVVSNPNERLLTLYGLNGKAETDNIFNTPRVNMDFKLGRGQANILRWDNGKLLASTTKEKADFNMALVYDAKQRNERRQNRKQSKATANTAKTPAKASPTVEVLALTGDYQYKTSLLSLNHFILQTATGQQGVRLTQPAHLSFAASGVSTKNLEFDVMPEGHIHTTANIKSNTAVVEAKLKDIPLALAKLFTEEAIPGGHVNADITLNKTTKSLTANLKSSATLIPVDSTSEDDPVFLVNFEAMLDNKPTTRFTRLKTPAGIVHLHGEGTLEYTGEKDKLSQKAVLTFALPFKPDAEGIPVLQEKAPFGVKATWSGNIEPLWGLFPLADREISGFGKVDLGLGGSLSDPRYLGSAYLADARFEDKVLGVMLEKINLEAKGNSRELNLLLAAEDGRGGSVAMQGAVMPHEQVKDKRTSLLKSRSAATPPRMLVRGHIAHLQPLHRDDLSIMLSGILKVEGPVNALDVQSNMILERGELNIAALSGGSVQTLEVVDEEKEAEAKEHNNGPSLDVTLDIPRRFYVRGRGLESEWGGKLQVKGFAAKPVLTGGLRPVHGYFDLMSKPFAFSEESRVSFEGGERINPGLDLNLKYKSNDLTAIIKIGGFASKPIFKLESDPALPQDQILAQVLFGKNVTSLSRFEAFQVANGIRELTSGGGGFNPLASVRETLGIDTLRVSSGDTTTPDSRNTYGTPDAASMGAGGKSDSADDDAAPRLEAGKYITDSIYVGFEQGVTENSTGVRVEVELSPRINLQGKSNMQSSEVGLGWKKDY